MKEMEGKRGQEMKEMEEEGKTIAEKIEEATSQVTGKEESAALEVLVDSLFEYGDVLFDPDSPSGPSLVINNESGTEISLTKEQAEALLSVGVPCFAKEQKTPSFDDLLNATTDNARLLMEKVRDACEEDNFMEVLRQLAPLIAKEGEKEDGR